jgi:hypothetical protein
LLEECGGPVSENIFIPVAITIRCSFREIRITPAYKTPRWRIERLDREAVLKLLEDLKAEMKETLGDKLVGLLLFGSYSRGDYSASSDVDLVILADGELSRAEGDAIDDLIAERSFRHDVVISAIVYPSKTFQEYSTPFLLSVKEDGIAI